MDSGGRGGGLLCTPPPLPLPSPSQPPPFQSSLQAWRSLMYVIRNSPLRVCVGGGGGGERGRGNRVQGGEGRGELVQEWRETGVVVVGMGWGVVGGGSVCVLMFIERLEKQNHLCEENLIVYFFLLFGLVFTDFALATWAYVLETVRGAV